MKKFLLILAALAGASLLGGCSKEASAMLSIDEGADFLSLDGLARSGEITVTASAPWTVELPEEADWFALSKLQGTAGESRIGIVLQANEGAARTALLKFYCRGQLHTFRLSQSARSQGEGFDEVDYCFYVTFGTLPTLYAGLHLLSHDKPSMVAYERASTYDAALFPAHARVSPVADPSGYATLDEQLRMERTMKRRILEINEQDPTAVFGLWVDDLRCRLGYDWFVAQGIDSTRVRVTMLSDGTATYNNFYQYFGDPATAEANWDAYDAEIEALDWNHGGRFPETRAPQQFDSYTWPYALATRPGYRLMLQNGALLESSGPFMTEKLAAMKIRSVQPYELLEQLPDPARQQFYALAKFDYDRFEALFDASPKDNLVILGTSHTTDASRELQARYVERIIRQYGDRYDLFFKPHPADASSTDYPERFPGLVLLPGQMPFEIFVWSLLDRIALIGGYPSTTYLSVPLDKVGFLFAQDAASLVRPLNLLFRDVPGVEWMPQP